MKYRILIADKLAPVAATVLEEAGMDVVTRHGLSERDLVEAVKGFHGVLVRSAVRITAGVIEASDVLKVIGRAGIGVDNIDVEAASRKGVTVMNVPGGNSITAAEHTIALMFALARNIPQAHSSLKSGEWKRSRFIGRELTGLTLGVIGYGNVGRIVADRALGLKMKVVAYDPLVRHFTMEGAGVRPVNSVDEVLAISDVVTVHTPLNPKTRGMIGRDALARAKVGMMLINVSRGGVVDEEALAHAIEEGIVSGAAVDVWQSEPPPRDDPLLRNDKVIVTPHLGASTREAQIRVATAIAQQVRDFLADGVAYGVVNP